MVLSRARHAVARSCVGWLPCGGLGVGAASSDVGAPGFGSRVSRSAGLVVSGAVRNCRVPSLGISLNRPTRRWNKPRAGKRSQFSLQERKVGAAQVSARTHDRENNGTQTTLHNTLHPHARLIA